MPKITEMWAYISEENGPDDEGVVAMAIGGDDRWIPFVGADEERMRSLKPQAEMTATITGRKVKLVKFSTREEIEVIEPEQ